MNHSSDPSLFAEHTSLFLLLSFGRLQNFLFPLNSNSVMKSITGRLPQVTENMFVGYGTKIMSVECLAKYGEHIFDSKKLTVQRVESTGQASPYSGSSSGSGYSANPFSPPGPGSTSSYSGSGNPYLRDPSRSGSSNPYLGEPGLDDSDQVKFCSLIRSHRYVLFYSSFF